MAADVVLQKAPPLTVRQTPDYPENLARYHFGAEVKATPESASVAKLQLSANGQDPNTSAAALLCDDPTTGYRLPAGTSSILVSLANIENIQSVSFPERGRQRGDVDRDLQRRRSREQPGMAPHRQRRAFPGSRLDPDRPGGSQICEAHFPGDPGWPDRCLWRLRHAGGVGFHDATSAQGELRGEFSNFALINFNFSDVHAKARALYVSSGDVNQVNAMIDDQPATAYRFAPDDAAPTAVIDLGGERSLSRLSAVYAAQPGSVDFYV